MSKDLLGNEVKVNDTVVSYNNLYTVLSVHGSYMRIKLIDPSKTTRAQNRYYKELVVVSGLINKEITDAPI